MNLRSLKFLAALLALTIFVGNCYGQSRAIDSSYTPFLLSNSTWVDWDGSSYCDGGTTPVTYEHISPTTDTTINGRVYKCLVDYIQKTVIYCDPFYTYVYDVSPGFIKGFLRQDTLAKLVYYLPAESDSEQVLYNFNLKIGDTINNINQPSDYSVVIYIDSFFSNNTYYRRYNLNGIYSPSFAWIEGFGSLGGIFCPTWCEYDGLGCFCLDGVTIFSQDGDSCEFAKPGVVGIPQIKQTHLQIYPNPAHDYVLITTDESTIGSNLKIFDVTGREQLNSTLKNTETKISTSQLPPGFYLIAISDAGGQVYAGKLVVE